MIRMKLSEASPTLKAWLNPSKATELTRYSALRASQIMEDQLIKNTKSRTYDRSKSKQLTGRLLGGIRNRALAGGDSREIIQNPQIKGAKFDYAPGIENGVKPYVIKAKNKKVLAVPLTKWLGATPAAYGQKKLPGLSKNGNFVILGRSVNHPGFKGTNSFKDAFKFTTSRITDIFKDSVKKFYS